MDLFKLSTRWSIVLFSGFVWSTASGQVVEFSLVPPAFSSPSNIEEFFQVRDGSVAFADVDLDGDQDLFSTGQPFGTTYSVARLYLNDGLGNFYEDLNNNFIGVKEGTADFADIDGDGDADLFISGKTGLYFESSYTDLWLNDGNGLFLPAPAASFRKITAEATVLVDLTGDGLPEILQSGRDSSGTQTGVIYYENLGGAAFVELTAHSLSTLAAQKIVAGDITGNGVPDVLVSGIDITTSLRTTAYYVNNGLGLLNASGVLLAPAAHGEDCIADFDNDGDNDLIVTGASIPLGTEVANLYLNDGTGQMTLAPVQSLPVVKMTDAVVVDTDMDGDLDIICLAPVPGGGHDRHQLLINDGNAVFTLAPRQSFFLKGHSSSIAVADVEGDGDPDILINSYQVSFHINENGAFKRVTSSAFSSDFNDMDAAFGDIDQDGDVDAVIIGVSSPGWDTTIASLPFPISRIMRNDGDGNFYPDSGNVLFALSHSSSLILEDLDADGDLDLITLGFNNQIGRRTSYYTNDGTGQFSLVPTSTLPNVLGSIEAEDLDGDGDRDLLITGSDSTNQSSTRLFENDGAGSFTEIFPGNFTEFTGWGLIRDMNNDGHMDILLSGSACPPGAACQLKVEVYLNDGSGYFVENTPASLTTIGGPEIKTADLNGDGLLDLYTQDGPIVRTFYNDGLGGFIPQNASPYLMVTQTGKVHSEAADVDSDGDFDMLISYVDTSSIYRNKTRIYENLGSGAFNPSPIYLFNNIGRGKMFTPDIDGDMDPDLVHFGYQYHFWRSTLVFRNETQLAYSVQPEIGTIDNGLIYPNPAPAGTILNCDMPAVQAQVFDLNGKRVSSSLTLPSNLGPGVYSVSIQDKMGQLRRTKICVY